jgi:hypothetical protein
MASFDVEIVLKGRDFAVTETIDVPHGEPRTWNEAATYDVLAEILRAIDRAQKPSQGQVVLAIEIPMGAAVAGPFAIDGSALDALITRTIRLDRMKTSDRVH